MSQITKPRRLVIRARQDSRMSLDAFARQLAALGGESRRPVKVFMDGGHPDPDLLEGITHLLDTTRLAGVRPRIITVFRDRVPGDAAAILLCGDRVEAGLDAGMGLPEDFYQEHPDAARGLALKMFRRLLVLYSVNPSKVPYWRKDAAFSLPDHAGLPGNAYFDLPALVCGICHRLPLPLRRHVVRMLELTSEEFQGQPAGGENVPGGMDYDLTQIIARGMPDLFSASDLRLIRRNHRLKKGCKTSGRIIRASQQACGPFLGLWTFARLSVENLGSIGQEIRGRDAYWLGLVDRAF